MFQCLVFQPIVDILGSYCFKGFSSNIYGIVAIDRSVLEGHHIKKLLFVCNSFPCHHLSKLLNEIHWTLFFILRKLF
ncbi:Uncharacterized protein APZ42_003675 [Daphnia magna]|uniref:Uncharacterized protein n=1 Tax=Daphnia magna TaxID=35525 RepID=A0A162C275_9CRUS|nr:Uncharacterized protein APZ42_003675 [Daphnia magna]